MAVRTNLCDNPSIELNSNTWFAVGNCTVAVDATKAFAGSKSFKATTTAAGTEVDVGAGRAVVTAGQTYTLSTYVFATAGRTLLADVDWKTAADAYLSGTRVTIGTASGGWDRVSITGTAPTNAGFAYMVPGVGGAAAGEFVWCDATLIEAGNTLGGYFDGSTVAAGFTYAWTGTAHASTSTESPRTLIHSRAPGRIAVQRSANF